MRVFARLAALILFSVLAVHSAAAAKRIALVIGNNDYPSLTAEEQLKRAVNDANAIGDALESLGFEVMRGENLSRGAMLSSLIGAADKIEPGDIGFFFFAGHGVSIDGSNYLLPADIPAAGSGAEDLIKLSAISEATVIETLKSRGAGVAVVVLDACRNNPFSQGGTRAFGDATRGLSRPPSVQPQGVFGLYSAGFGEQALDGLGDDDSDPNSIFTRVLAPALTEPGQSLLDIAYRVNDEVARLAESVGHEQNPAYYDQARARDVFLVERSEESEVAAAPTEAGTEVDSAPRAPASDPCASARLHFDAARALGRIEALEDHVAKFPSCEFADLAEMLIEGMRNDAASTEEQQVANLPDARDEAVEPVSDEISVLGMSIAPITNTERDRYDIASGVSGVVLTSVEPGSPAEAEGIVAGMVIVEAGNEQVDSPDDLTGRMERLLAEGRRMMLLRLAEADGNVRFVALQFPAGDGAGAVANAEPEAAAVGEAAAPDQTGRPWLGIEVQDLTAEVRESFGVVATEGVLISFVETGGPAASGGVEMLDVLIEFGGQPIRSISDLALAVGEVKPGEAVDTVLLRNGERLARGVLIGSMPAEPIAEHTSN